jgi:hypothetical protein
MGNHPGGGWQQATDLRPRDWGEPREGCGEARRRRARRFELVHLPKKDRRSKVLLRLGVAAGAFFSGASHRSAELALLMVRIHVTSS